MNTPREKGEQRLEQLREEARRTGKVEGAGIRAAGGPTPENLSRQGYYHLPIIKPPVWEWMIAVYFFVGGLAGMSGLVAVAALVRNQFALARTAMWLAGIGAILSPILLIWDLGRPMRFLYMLRVFKYQSPMSVGSWILAAFGSFAVPGLALTEWHWHNLQVGAVLPAVHILAIVGIAGTGFLGVFLGTYTGALIAASSVPAWNTHRVLLPFHFGMTGLGSAVATLQVIGFHERPLTVLFVVAAVAEILVQLRLELRKHGRADRALYEGTSGWILRAGELLAGPAALILQGFGLIIPAGSVFLLGALLARFGWLSAGRASALDPEATIASQRGEHPTAEARRPYSLKPAVASAGSTRRG